MEQLQLAFSNLGESSALNAAKPTVTCSRSTPKRIRNYINPLPMQYLGSKARIADWLLDAIDQEFPECNTFFDLFSGTGSVALEAITRNYSIIANDIQPYSYAILRSLFSLPKDQLKELVADLEKLKTESNLLERHRSYLENYLWKEDSFYKKLLSKEFEWKNYQEFCETTPVVSNNLELEEQFSDFDWNLFCRYYANNYFGIRQSLEIDTIRQFADGLETPQKENLLAAAISVLTFAVSSTTHLAQFLKPNCEKQAVFLLKKRSIKIIDAVIDRIKNLQSFQNHTNGKIYNLDFIDAIKRIPPSENIVVYADPPYFKEHYSRYYHVLDTFYLYDYPKLTINDRTLDLTTGRYRENRIRSDFGLKSKVASAFESMLKECQKKGFRIAISYADTSLIEADQLLKIIGNYYFTTVVKKRELLHSAQGQPRNKIAQEYLYLLKA